MPGASQSQPAQVSTAPAWKARSPPEVKLRETGPSSCLAFDMPVIMPVIEMEFADAVTVATETGDVLAFE